MPILQEERSRSRSFFITGTDTGVGKTRAVWALGLLLQQKGLDVGVFKPVQSGGAAGGDAGFLKARLRLKDALREINPYCAPESLSPHIALPRAGIKVDKKKILSAFQVLKDRHDWMLTEGAGGLLVPINKNYLMADLAVDLGAELIIVSRLGLGTINHTLLTVREAERRGVRVAGILFCDATGKAGIPEKTNPEIIRALSGVPVLGCVPFLKTKDEKKVLAACRKSINLQTLLSRPAPQTERLTRLDKECLWHPFTQMKDWLNDVPARPLIIDRAQGSYLIDTDERRYLDGVSSLWVTAHGHNRREITDALSRQAAKLDHSTMLGLANTPAVELAAELVKISPRGLNKVFYSDNGSTAVEIAIKMSYQYWQNMGQKRKALVCHLANSYHGDTLGSVSVGGIDLFHKVYRKLIFKTHKVDFPDCFRAPAGKKYPDYAFEALDLFEAFLKKDHQEVASLVLEPLVQGAAGMIVWPKGVLKRFEALCRKYDVLLIADEVATGFGRTGKMFACEHEDVHPDFLCVAKGLSGGVLPLAATLTTQRVFDGFLRPYRDMKTFFHGHTYTGNPIACAAALANLVIFRKDRTLERLQPKIKYLGTQLQRLRDIPCVGDIRQCGFMVGIELVRDRDSRISFCSEERTGARVCVRARELGVILRPLGDVIVLMPPLGISREELDLLVRATERAIRDCVPGGGQ
jgi:adenosylmethionine-8-amino-7-oxononanoate aminotransferase